MVFTIDLSSCKDVSLVGGKAYNLSIMINNNVPVPKGFVISCEAFDSFINSNKLNIESCSPDDIISGKFPADIEEEISQQYTNFFGEEKLVAVRSSGVNEDSAEHAYAGMYSSFLNTSFENLFLKIKECWASSRNERVIEYAKGDKLFSRPAIGVIVQDMVPSESAGVVFTMNPVTQDKSYFVINSSSGLGESVVSGHVTPDTFICHKISGEIISQSTVSNPPSLSPETLEKVLELARKIQDVFSTDQDIEFAWDGTTVWALQARPITTISKNKNNNNNNNNNNNINPSRLNDICCNHETVDVFPDVITPLTWTTFDYIVHHSILQRYKQKDIVFPQDCSMYELHWGRVYQNLTVADMMVQSEFGFNPDQSTKAVKGDLWKPERAPSTTPLIDRIKGLGRLMTSLWDSTATATKVTQIIIDCEKWCKEKEIELQKMDTEKITEDYLNSFRKVITNKFCEFGCEYIDIRMQIFYHATEVFLENAAKNLGGKTDFFIAALLSDLGGVFTFEMNKELRKLAELAANDEKVIAFLNDSGKWSDFQTELAGTTFVTHFVNFLENYGYRAINELEASSTRWSEDPSFLFGQILTMSKLQTTSPLSSGSGAERQAIEAKLMAQVPFLQRYLTKWAIGKMQDYTRLRENAKCVLVRFIALSRRYLLRAAHAFVERGVIAHAHDVFFLRLSDLDEIFDAHAIAGAPDLDELVSRMRDRVRENSAQMERDRKLVFPDLFVGSVPRFAIRPDGSDTLKGIGASCGVVQGVARVLRSPNERDKLQSKDVCATTDPAWTPLFACCSALVSVHGGMLSHGAIVAREFGIPAVVGVANALTIIKDGTLINVDGNSGVVTLAD